MVKIRTCSKVFMFGLLTMAVVRGSLAQEGVSGNEPILMFGTSVVKSNVQGADIGNRELEQFISKHKTSPLLSSILPPLPTMTRPSKN